MLFNHWELCVGTSKRSSPSASRVVHISQTGLLGLWDEPQCHLPESENNGCQTSRAVSCWYCGGVFRTYSFLLQQKYVLAWDHKPCHGVVASWPKIYFLALQVLHNELLPLLPLLPLLTQEPWCQNRDTYWTIMFVYHYTPGAIFKKCIVGAL